MNALGEYVLASLPEGNLKYQCSKGHQLSAPSSVKLTRCISHNCAGRLVGGPRQTRKEAA